MLAGKVKHELNCAPVDNPESKYLIKIMTEEAMRPKHQTVYIKDDVTYNNSSYVQPGTLKSTNAFGGFIVSIFIPFLCMKY